MGSRLKSDIKFGHHIRKIKQSEKERAAIAMLLGAEWDDRRQCFVKHTSGHSQVVPWHYTHFYDRKGNELPGDPKPPKPDRGRRVGEFPRIGKSCYPIR